MSSDSPSTVSSRPRLLAPLAFRTSTHFSRQTSHEHALSEIEKAGDKLYLLVTRKFKRSRDVGGRGRCTSGVSMYSDYKPVLGKERTKEKQRERKIEKETDRGKLGSPFVINISAANTCYELDINAATSLLPGFQSR